MDELLKDHAQRVIKIGRKVNSNADPKEFQSYEIMIEECKRRGVRFLPKQAIRPQFKKAGLI